MSALNFQDQLHEAHRLLMQQQHEPAKAILSVLANQNYAPAMTDLGMILLMEFASAETTRQGLDLLHRAEQQDYLPAAYHLACISLSDASVALDWQQLQQRLLRCCQAQHPEALCDAAMLLAHFGTPDALPASNALLEMAALRGNTVAMALLGERLAQGLGVYKDTARANAIRRLAVQMDLPVPAPNGPESRPEPAFTPSMPNTLELPDARLALQHPEAQLLQAEIQLKTVARIFSDEECLYIQCMGGPQLQPSISVDDSGTHHRNRIRTSYDFLFQPEHESVYLKLLQWRMVEAAGLPLKHAESLTLLRYTPGQEYKPHRDYLPSSHYTSVKNGGAGQRLRTAIAYLNTPESGGETEFPLFGVRIPAITGQLVLFDNINAEGALNERSFHAGAPVKQGVKWICTLWIREQALRTL